jgi:hypothetical protein
MPYNKTVVADSVITRLIENQGIYTSMNRSFDGLVRPGATSVDIPALAIPEVKTTGTATVNAGRKKAKADTNMINVSLSPYVVPLAEEILAQYESNGQLIKNYLDSASMALQEKFDSIVVEEAQTTTDKSAFAGASMAWADVIDITKRFDLNKVPKSQRVIAVSAGLASEFFNIDVIKNAVGYNSAFLTSGTLLQLMGMKFFISGLVSTVTVGGAAKENMVGIYGPGLAFILSRMGDVKEAWDTANLQQVVDMIAHAGCKLFDNKFAVVKYKP